MTSAEVVSTIMGLMQNTMTFMLPIIAVLSAVNFVFGFIFDLTFGMERRQFRNR